jgi:chorismate dehydratase
MASTETNDGNDTPAAGQRRVGCVSFLNAKPLIEGFRQSAPPGVQLEFDVPSALLDGLETGRTDIALCPVIDFYRSREPLEIVPVGGIGCHRSTLTVKLCSRTPIDRIRCIHADTDSHTSVALMQIVLHEAHGIRPQIVSYDATGDESDRPDTVLLIGDKVVRAAPHAVPYRYQLDLGEAWAAQTGLPFVFAVWMARRGVDLGPVPRLLEARRVENARRIDQIVAKHAEAHGWPRDLAQRYLGQLLQYEIGPTQLEAIELFATKAYELGLIDAPRPLCVRGGIADSVNIVAP